MARSPAATVCSAAALVGVDRHRAVRLAHTHVAEGVVQVLVGVDDRRQRPGPEAAYVVDDLARHALGPVGVDHEQSRAAADQGDVHVEPVVARDPDPVADLGEAGHGREPSRLGTPPIRVPE